LRIKALVFHGVPHGDPLLDQGQKVFVPRQDHHLEALVPSPAHQGGDQVVGFETILFQSGQVQALDDFLNVGELHGQLFGHGGPVGLVLRIFPVPKGRGLGVEGQGQILRLALPEDLEQHIGDAERGIGGKALGVGQAADGVESPVNIGTDVQEIKDPGGHKA